MYLLGFCVSQRCSSCILRSNLHNSLTGFMYGGLRGILRRAVALERQASPGATQSSVASSCTLPIPQRSPYLRTEPQEEPRSLKDHINIRILQTMVSGILPGLGPKNQDVGSFCLIFYILLSIYIYICRSLVCRISVFVKFLGSPTETHAYRCCADASSRLLASKISSRPSPRRCARRGRQHGFQVYTFNYQNHLPCRLPITLYYGFTIGTCNNDGFGSQWCICIDI